MFCAQNFRKLCQQRGAFQPLYVEKQKESETRNNRWRTCSKGVIIVSVDMTPGQRNYQLSYYIILYSALQFMGNIGIQVIRIFFVSVSQCFLFSFNGSPLTFFGEQMFEFFTYKCCSVTVHHFSVSSTFLPLWINLIRLSSTLLKNSLNMPSS